MRYIIITLGSIFLLFMYIMIIKDIYISIRDKKSFADIIMDEHPIHLLFFWIVGPLTLIGMMFLFAKLW
jgi:hypothetical protein